MKVIITVGTYYPMTDGVQAVTEYLAEGMAERGHTVIVLTRWFSGMEENEIHNGVEIKRCHIDTVHALHKGDIDGYQKLVVELCEDADAIICVCPQIVTTDALLPILGNVKCKKILYMHGMHSFKIKKFEIETPTLLLHKMWNQIRWGWLYFGHKKWFKQFDRIIQIHRFDGTYDFIEKNYGIKSDIIENAADASFFEEVECASPIEGSYIINVSNYIHRKNQLDTLEAYYRSATDMSLVFIGSSKTPYYKKIEEMNEKLGKKYHDKKVILLSDIPRNEIANYVRNASLYVMNSRWEVFPISLIEAMAAGVPFITSDVGIARFLPGGVVANTVEETQYWIDLLSNNVDTRQKLGEAGRAYAVGNLMIAQKVEQLINLINVQE